MPLGMKPGRHPAYDANSPPAHHANSPLSAPSEVQTHFAADALQVEVARLEGIVEEQQLIIDAMEEELNSQSGLLQRDFSVVVKEKDKLIKELQVLLEEQEEMWKAEMAKDCSKVKAEMNKLQLGISAELSSKTKQLDEAHAEVQRHLAEKTNAIKDAALARTFIAQVEDLERQLEESRTEISILEGKLQLKQQNHEREQKAQADLLEKLLEEVENTSLLAAQDRDKLATQRDLIVEQQKVLEQLREELDNERKELRDLQLRSELDSATVEARPDDGHDGLVNELESQLVANLKLLKEFQTTAGALQLSELQLRSELDRATVEARQNGELVNELESQLAAKSKLLEEYKTTAEESHRLRLDTTESKHRELQLRSELDRATMEARQNDGLVIEVESQLAAKSKLLEEFKSKAEELHRLRLDTTESKHRELQLRSELDRATMEARQNDGLVKKLESQLAAKSKLLKEYQTRPNWLEEYHDLLSNEGVVQISAENRALKIRLDELLEELKAWKSAPEKGLENVVCSVSTSESFEKILEEDARIKKLEHVIAAQHEDLKNLMDTVVDLQEENRDLQTLSDEKLGECWETERFQLEKTWKRHAMEWSKDTDRFKSQIKQLQMELEAARGERTASTTPQGDIVYQQQIMELQVELENSRHKLAITEERTQNMAAVMEQNVQRMLSDQIIEFSKQQDRELAVALANERATASATLLVEQGLRTEAENKAKDLADRNKELEMELSEAQSRFSEFEIRSDVVGSLAKEKEFSLDAMAKMADELQQEKTANATLKLKQLNHEREQKVQADMLEKLLNEVANTSLVAVQDRDKLAAQKELVGSLAKEKECALEAVATMEDELQKEKTANATLTAEIVRLSAKEKEHAEDLQRYQHISAGSIFLKNAALNENAALKSQLEANVEEKGLAAKSQAELKELTAARQSLTEALQKSELELKTQTAELDAAQRDIITTQKDLELVKNLLEEAEEAAYVKTQELLAAHNQIALCADFAAKEEENAQLKTELDSTKEALRKMKIFRM